MKKLFGFAVASLLAFAAVGSAQDKEARKDEKKDTGPVKLTLVAKTDKYKFDGGGKTPEEFKALLEEAKKSADKGKPVAPPKAPAVDLVLQFTNTGKEEVTIHVGGDSNVWTFELTGEAGVAALPNFAPMTLEFRIPKAVTLAPGKSHEIPVKSLADGTRGVGRFVYWTGPGEYKLSAKYQLSDKDGGKAAELKSEPVKITVEK
ncbi:MAG: hypothetical protein K2V38_20860 [Gemmataceae bacterium]|nr:hypothetical protein [Gemmataceae bacterium]